MKDAVLNILAAVEILVISAMGSSAFFATLDHATSAAIAAGAH